MSDGIDFSDCKRNLNTYGGANGNKIGIIYNGENYMLKFPSNIKNLTKQKIKGEYTNSCVNEYVGSHIFQSLGIEAQETLLGTYQDKIVVACKDFESDGYRFADFASLKNTVIDSESNGYGTELKDILYIFEEQMSFEISPQDFKEHFWKMFIVDSLLGNFDRHNGNWGFLINKELGKVKFAPIFDCGSCLFPKAVNDKMFKDGMSNQEIRENRLYLYPNSAIKLHNKKINIFNFLSQTDNQDCLQAYDDIIKHLNLEVINKIIDETPYISDLNKEFLKFIVFDRKKNLLEKAILENKNISRLYINETDIPRTDFAGFEFSNTSGMDKIRDEALAKEQSSINTQKPTKNDGDKPDIDEDKPSGPSGPRM